MPRTAKVHLSKEHWERLTCGETIVVRLPPQVRELQLSVLEGDDFAYYFEKVFSKVWRKVLGKIENAF